MKKPKKPENLRLMKWAQDGFPPLNLSNEVESVIDLIHEVNRLRKLLPPPGYIGVVEIDAISERYAEAFLTDHSLPEFKRFIKSLKTQLLIAELKRSLDACSRKGLSVPQFTRKGGQS